MIIVAEECSDMSTCIHTHWVTHLRVSRLLNICLVWEQREGDSERGSGKSQNSSVISRMVPKGSETLLMIHRKVSIEN
jgi:hypothetical protein